MKTIRATVLPSWQVQLDFGYDPELVAFVKDVSGFRWDKARRKWVGAMHSVAALLYAAWKEQRQVQIPVAYPLLQAPPILVQGMLQLRDYQQWAVGQLLSRREFVLVWAPRVGKTIVIISASASAIATRMVDRTIVVTPSGVLHEWEGQLKKSYPGMQMRQLVRGLGAEDVAKAHFVLVAHEEVAQVKKELGRLATFGRFALAFDEPQRFQDWKAPRSKAMAELAHSPSCVKVWGLTGTPMRNSPEDLPLFFEVFGGIGGTKWNFLKRYANAHEGEYGWVCGDPQNLDELAYRLASISHRLTREEVKKDLPAIDRAVRLCDLTRADGKRYKALEAALGKKALDKVNPKAVEALRTLTAVTLKAKMSTAVERVKFHCQQRGVKILAAAYNHDSLKELAVALAEAKVGFHLAGGWMPPQKRAEAVEAWRADPMPTPLLVNVLASGVGIDLSDADGAVVLEVPWVPGDAIQFEARILDVHLGKRTSPPWVEYLLTRGTIDEDMANANLRKIATIEAVVGTERESAALAEALRASGVVDTVDLGLSSQTEGAVEAALEGLRRRLMGGEDPSVSDPELTVSNAALAGAVAEAFEAPDEEEQADVDDDYSAAG